MRDLEKPGRSPVRAVNGMVSAPNALASLTAIETLKAGGNAVDAAIAAMAVLGVVESLNVGIGGDCFVLIAPHCAMPLVAYNGSGRASAAASAEDLRARGFRTMPETGPHSVTIPGAVDAWATLAADHGSKGLDELLSPAIRYAEEGYVVHDSLAMWWALEAEKLAADPVAARTYLVDGRAPSAGTVHRQPSLAATLRSIGRHGPRAFYEGAIAEDMVERLSELGGTHTLDDFAMAKGAYVTPIETTYRGHQVHECPPNGQGLAALQMLNVLAGFDLATMDPLGAERVHLAIEAGRLAVCDRDAAIGDPDLVPVPVDRLLSPHHTDSLRHSIDPARARTDLPRPLLPEHRDTCHVAVVDRDLTAVSLIASVYHGFGSGIVAPRSGVLLQNRGAGFVLAPGHPNALRPRARPLHTIIPGLVTRNGRAAYVFGVVGGHYQPWGHAHVLTNLIDFGFDPQEALDLPRMFHDGEHVHLETGFNGTVVAGLRQRGHAVIRRSEAGDGPLGGAQLIVIDERAGTLTGAADPRLDGCALGY